MRMVNQAGMSPSALPLHVPPGHMVQQMVDEQVCLCSVSSVLVLFSLFFFKDKFLTSCCVYCRKTL